MFKAVWFQLHWLLGIVASVVLAVVGVTGAMLSFEHEILTALNPGVMTVEPAATGLLAPAELMDKVGANAPGRTITAVSVARDPTEAARVTLAPLPGGAGGPRGETRYVNPYDGTLLGEVSGQQFFRVTMQVHRWLASGDVGKQIVGASTIALIVLSLSGLYLRWPRRPLDLLAWFRLDVTKRGRAFLWELHSVIGTWVLPFYLLASFTGLYWSYDWYRGALFDLTGTPRPAQQGPRPGAAPAPAPGAAPANGSAEAPRAQSPAANGPGRDGGGRPAGGARPAPLDIASLWPVFLREAGDYTTATLRLPQGGARTLTITYQGADAAHARANNTLVLDASGAVREHRRYADLPAGQKLMASIFVLHAGSFFGLPGLILMMLASLLMPLFAITGWMLYLDRRKKKRSARAAAGSFAGGTAGAPLLVAYASQTGTAEQLAWQSASTLQAAGLSVSVSALGDLQPQALAGTQRALFIVSTFGDGEPPDSARAFARRMAGTTQVPATLEYGVLALGDRSYERYCGFGHDLDAWLRTRGATPLFDRIEVDGNDPAALRHWLQHLGTLSGQTHVPDWTPPSYESWRLTQRQCLNPGSLGLPTFHIALEPEDGTRCAWTAGDVVEIGPSNGAEAVSHALAALALPAEQTVTQGLDSLTLGACLARSLLPPLADLSAVRGRSAQQVADMLAPLPHRDYSIASIPADGRIELLVRQARLADGTLGLGSGWLTAHAPAGASIALRVRENRGFHPPDPDRPLILVGNGTGLAGLRAHLKARVHAGRERNWLLFGERSRAHDFYFRDEITAWQSAGALTRADFAFSRDQGGYVQDLLVAAGADIRAWLADGAAIYVCGSLQGMAPAVDRVLVDLIGAPALEALAENRRYCRDVY